MRLLRLVFGPEVVGRVSDLIFEALTLASTGKVEPVPTPHDEIVLFVAGVGSPGDLMHVRDDIITIRIFLAVGIHEYAGFSDVWWSLQRRVLRVSNAPMAKSLVC